MIFTALEADMKLNSIYFDKKEEARYPDYEFKQGPCPITQSTLFTIDYNNFKLPDRVEILCRFARTGQICPTSVGGFYYAIYVNSVEWKLQVRRLFIKRLFRDERPLRQPYQSRAVKRHSNCFSLLFLINNNAAFGLVLPNT